MRKLIAAVCLLAPALAFGQVQVNIGLPQIVFPAPPSLVVVSPGVQVVPDYDDEVFFVDNWYWVRRDDRWFRARDHRGGWAVVERHGVPVRIVEVPRGKYKRYKHVVVEKRGGHEQHHVLPAGGKHGGGKHGGGKHKGKGKD